MVSRDRFLFIVYVFLDDALVRVLFHCARTYQRKSYVCDVSKLQLNCLLVTSSINRVRFNGAGPTAALRNLIEIE
jgi:hypothetical protein